MKTQLEAKKKPPSRGKKKTIVLTQNPVLVRVYMYHPRMGLYEMPGSKFLAACDQDITDQVCRIYETNPVTYLTHKYDQVADYYEPEYTDYAIHPSGHMFATPGTLYTTREIRPVVGIFEPSNPCVGEVEHFPIVYVEKKPAL